MIELFHLMPFTMLLLLCLTTTSFLGNAAGQTTNCLQTNNENRLPTFQGYGYRRGQRGAPDRRIQHQHQAIIPSYKFNCCGNITEWGVDLNPDGVGVEFDFIFQVWRPSPTVNVSGCYSLVNGYMSKNITIKDSPPSERVARITSVSQEQLQFQPGDVLGFYVESHGQGDVPGGDHDNGVVLLNDIDYRNESVWFTSIDITAQTSQSGCCPYPVGTNGLLRSLTNAAPVISISITTYSCSPFTTYLPISSPTTIAIHTESKSVHFTQPGNEPSAMSTTSINYLVLGVSVSVIALVALVIFTAVLVAAVITGKYRKQSSTANTEQDSDSEVYMCMTVQQ